MPGSLSFHVYLIILLKNINEVKVLCSVFDMFNLLKPTSYVKHYQFNIQQLYALPTLYLCVLY